jgi:hypothetical protein
MPSKFFLLIVPAFLIFSCVNPPDKQLDELIAREKLNDASLDNIFNPRARMVFLDSVLKRADSSEALRVNYQRAKTFMELGDVHQTLKIFNSLRKHPEVKGSEFDEKRLQKELAFAYLRMAETDNCLMNHSAESCIFPIRGGGIHIDTTGSAKAIKMYEEILARNPSDIESRWFLNIAYMTLGQYPHAVPEKYLIVEQEQEELEVHAFEDIAARLNLDLKNQAGGVIVDDFDNDGYLDIVTSAWGINDEMHYFSNNADGTFTNRSEESGLKHITGGLNIAQTDYNNDGFKDIFVARGAWKKNFGEQHNSLLKNNGDGTFTQVTIESGLLSSYPTQAITWNDFNNDGWLDLFIGNETSAEGGSKYPCQLYINNQDGTFSDKAQEANIDILSYIKGVTSGDYDNDGLKDIFITTMNGKRFLMRNSGIENSLPVFEDVTAAALLDKEKNNSFVTWFWDYDNDGWLDIMACDYSFTKSLGYYAAAERLGIDEEYKGQPVLYRNNADGTFSNVTQSAGLFKSAFAMGSNFGDIDNDGFLDIFMGTGNPNFNSLVPNKMFKNAGGKKFADITGAARVGSLQKGHAVAFADMDNDGDQDIYIQMGGAYIGDAYQNSFFLNPGQNNNNWICVDLEGVKSNRPAIGTTLKIAINENGKMRQIYRDVNSGGSFGSSPLRREIGLGSAAKIDTLEIKWHGSGEIQIFTNIPVNQFLKIKEGEDDFQKLNPASLSFKNSGNEMKEIHVHH